MSSDGKGSKTSLNSEEFPVFISQDSTNSLSSQISAERPNRPSRTSSFEPGINPDGNGPATKQTTWNRSLRGFALSGHRTSIFTNLDGVPLVRFFIF
jgi:hypothetical protein